MMNCQNVKPLLSEFADETLDAAAAWQVQTHLSACTSCAEAARDLAAVKRLVQTLPAKAPPAGFDAALAQRLALTRRPAAPPPPSWPARLARFFAPLPAAPLRRKRPALALGALLAAGIFAAILTGRPAAPPAPAAVRGTDPAFVAACVAQHHRDAASEPLADLSAQTLAGSLDAASAPSGSGAASPDTDADAGLF